MTQSQFSRRFIRRVCAVTTAMPLVFATGFAADESKPFEVIVEELSHENIAGAAQADQAFNDTNIAMKFDGFDINPILNVGLASGGDAALREKAISFRTFWNYSAFIEKAEIRIFKEGQSVRGEATTVLPVQNGQVEDWTPTDFNNDTSLSYVLRVYSADGNFDETQAKSITFVDRLSEDNEQGTDSFGIYGMDATARRNIKISGGAISVSGKSIAVPSEGRVTVLGESVFVDKDGDFITQEIVPFGDQKITVGIENADGEITQISRDVHIPKSEFFLVAIGDLTIGHTDDDSREVLTAEDEDFDRTFVHGRGAFYLKGKVKGDYLITASLDTTEGDIGNIFSNLNEKDPQAFLRRLDADRFYPIYGDDSSVYEDAPTQGRFYVRVERGDDHVVWGNFTTNILSTEFAQLDRALYGGKIEYNSDETTSFGDRKTRVVGFVADPGTTPAREEFLGSGGSVYFLENQDLTIGSERLRIEIRDKDNGLVLETRDLLPQEDYDIDYIQGRVLLARPLSSTRLDGQTVRDGSLSGNNVFLVARYEYTPGLDDIGGFSTGGRGEQWLGDHLKLGVTGQQDETGDVDQTLVAGDVTVRLTETTYLKAEVARTSGASFDERNSFDGGFTFNQLTPGLSSEEAFAYRIEGASNFTDLDGLSLDGNAFGYYENIDAGFSGVGRLTPNAREAFGGKIYIPFNKATSLALKYDEAKVEGGIDDRSLVADFGFQLGNDWLAKLGYRYDERSGTFSGNDGERNDIGIELRYKPSDKWEVYSFAQGTVSSTSTREERNRGGGGANIQLTEKLRVGGEVSGGDGGIGALGELTHTREDGSEYYLNYAIDTDRSDTGANTADNFINTQNALTIGGRQRYSDTVTVFGEQRRRFGQMRGLTQAYGVDIIPGDQWTLGATFEIGEIEDGDDNLIERRAIGSSIGYATDRISFASAFEWRVDETPLDRRRTFLIRNNLNLRLSENWRALARFNLAESNSSQGAFFDGDFTEGQIAAAYRPTTNDRLNALLRYTYFRDLAPAQQLSSSGQSGLPAQESHILNIDATYDIRSWLSLGGKYGYRFGEVSLSRLTEDFISSTTQLGVVRADIHLVRKWDAVIEGRILSISEAEDQRAGILLAAYRHLGDHAKLGVGYNFTDFSDDLTDLTYDENGVFVNVIGKF